MFGSERPIVIWASGGYLEMARKAVEMYRERDEDMKFELIEKYPSEISTALENAEERWNEDSDSPNIILVHDQDLKKYIKKYPNFFCSLDGFIDPYLFMSFKATNITTRKGEVYGCPCSSEPAALYYRRDILGYLPENVSWEELCEQFKYCRDNGYGGYLLPAAETLTQILMQSYGRLYYVFRSVI